ncbi:Protein of unknown function, partial [Cotesia congregata]
LHRTQKTAAGNREIIKEIKQLLELIRFKIQTEIKKNMENHWEKIVKKIDHRDPNKFFPVINKYSIVHAIHKLLTDVISHIDQDLIGATLIDLEKAFDTVWLHGLIYILIIITNNFPEHLIGTIWSIIT